MALGSKARGALRLAALMTASAAALCVAQPAAAQTTNAVIKPYYGNIRPFYGNLRPFYGNLRPFYGNLRPFYGKISPFWSTPDVFWGNAAAFGGQTSQWWGFADPVAKPAANAPAYLTVQPFWTRTGAKWETTMAAWDLVDPAATDAASYQGVADQLRALMTDADAFWGASVRAKTGKSFADAVAKPMMAKWGIDLNDPASLAALDSNLRASFFLDFYDTVMEFGGTDHVDWWMKSVNWSPNVTQTQGSGARTVIGLLDFTVQGDTTLMQNIVRYDGISTFSNGHGAAVGSLIVGAHDGQGVMGIAPKASVIAYNPFDATGSAGWADVANGILMLANNGASVVNMSLGVPGTTLDQGWNDVFSNRTVSRATQDMVFVVAAGNDGVVQTNNINWNFATNPTLLVVGSVDIEGHISNFSNQPGTACLLSNGVCSNGNRLMDRFLVAPGELILMSDDHGGVARQTGTSFAAPLVSGAIALLHDRWPWFANYPDETAQIILQSAKDLGAPGVDPVYGHGLLDIQASQSPLNFNDLHWIVAEQVGRSTQLREIPATTVLTRYKTEQATAWDAQGLFFFAYENIGGTLRDFAVPMSSKLVGQKFTGLYGYSGYYQGYLLGQMSAWAKSKGYLADATNAGGTYSLANPWGADLTLSMAPKTQSPGFRDNGVGYQTSLRVQGERSSVSVGFGDGAVALAGQPGFVLASDFKPGEGGANPLLGLASGGGYANWSLDLTDRLQIAAGASQRNERRDGVDTPVFDQPGNGAHAYRASARHVSLSYRLDDGLDLVGGYTQLREDAALLGIQSLDPQDFRGGSVTDGVSLGLAWQATPKLSVSAGGTLAKTRAGGGQNLAVGTEGLISQSYQLAVASRDLFAKGDAARLTLAQPMFVSHGRLDIDNVEVVDRLTGELGVVTHSLDISQARNYSAEALYSLPLFETRGELDLFGRAETQPGSTSELKSYVAGGRFRIAF